MYPLTLEAEVKGFFFPHCLARNIDINTKNKYKVLLQKCGYYGIYFLFPYFEGGRTLSVLVN